MAPKFFEKRESWFLEKAELEERLGELPNPSAGWYQLYTFSLDKDWTPEELRQCLNDRHRLSLVVIDIGGFRSRDLDEAALNNLRRILEFFQSSGQELILRVTYDTVGKGMEHEPTRFDRVQRHILQLTAVLRPFVSMIFVFQGILVGSWGEMHNSRHLTADRISAALSLLDGQLDGQVYLAVRKPAFYRLTVQEEARKVEHRIGLFNDGMFGSKTDLGTYGALPGKEAGWEQPWTPEEELAFQSVLCNTVPQGGEAVMPSQPMLPLEQTVERMKKMHVSYLNACHDPRILAAWKDQTWERLDAWHGVNGLDYIGAHLGYRFRVLDVKGSFNRWTGKFTVSLLLDNAGFASCYFPLELLLIQADEAGGIREYPVPAKLSELYAGKNMLVKCRVEPKKSQLYLKLTRRSDGRVIQLGTGSSGASDNGGELLLLGSLRAQGKQE